MATPPITAEEYKRILRDSEAYEQLEAIPKKTYDLMVLRLEQELLTAQSLGESEPDRDKLINKIIDEINEFTGPPLTSDYGTAEERRVQNASPPLNIEPNPNKPTTPLTAIRKQQIIASPRAEFTDAYEIDYDQVYKQFKKIGLSNEEANLNKSAFQLSVQNHQSQNQDTKLKDSFDIVLDEILNISNAPSLKGKSTGIKDPYIRAFRTQKTQGSVPDYSPIQQTFLSHINRKKVDKYIEENIDFISKASNTYRTVVLEDGNKLAIPVDAYEYITKTTLPSIVYNPTKDAAILKATAVTGGFGKKPNELIEDHRAIAKVRAYKKLGTDEWFLDPEKKRQVLENPDAFAKNSLLFEDTDIFGGTVEGSASWMFRSALMPLNIVAGAVMELTASESLSESKAAIRAKDSPLYADSPILNNIAINGGFMLESTIAADAVRLEDPYLRTLVQWGGFGADILDPTYAIALGTGKGLKSAAKMRTIQKQIYNTTNKKQISETFKKAFATAVIDDFNIISQTIKLLPESKEMIKSLKYGSDVRQILSDDLARSLSAKEIVERSVKQNYEQKSPSNALRIEDLDKIEAKLADAEIEEWRVLAAKFRKEEDIRLDILTKKEQEFFRGIAKGFEKSKVSDESDRLIQSSLEFFKKPKKVETADGIELKGTELFPDTVPLKPFKPVKAEQPIKIERPLGPYKDTSDPDFSDLEPKQIPKPTFYEYDAVTQSFDALKRAGLENTTYVNELKKKMAQSDFSSAVRQMDDTLKLNDKTIKMLNQLDGSQRYLDELFVSGKTKAMKYIDRQSTNANVDLVDAIVAGSKTGKSSKLSDFDLKIAKAKLNQSYATAIVFENTPAIKSLENLQAITRNTWVDKNKAVEILKNATLTPLGQALGRLLTKGKLKNAIKPRKSERTASTILEKSSSSAPVKQNYYVVNREDALNIVNYISRLNIPKFQKNYITENLLNFSSKNAKGKLFTDDYKLLVDANVDQMALGGKGVVSTDDVSRLPSKHQEKLLEGIGTPQRKWGMFGDRGMEGLIEVLSKPSKFIKKILQKQNRNIPTAPLKQSTFQQRRLVKEMQQELSTLDTKLIKEARALVESAELRASYLSKELAKDPISEFDAMGLLIVGLTEKGSRQSLLIEDTLEWAFKRLFVQSNEYESIFGRIIGTNKLIDNKLLSIEGEVIFKKELAKTAKKMINEPENFWKHFEDFADGWAERIKTNKKIKINNKEFSILNLNVKPKDILFYNKKLKAGSGVLQKFSIEANIAEQVGLGMYFNAESSRLLNKKLTEVVTAEFKTVSITEIFGGLKNVQPSLFESAIKEAVILSYNKNIPFGALLEDLMRSTTFGLKGLDKNVARKAIEYAEIIIRKNDISDYMDMDVRQVRELVDDLFDKQNEKFSSLLFGKEYYNQIQKALGSGRLEALTKDLDLILRTESNTTKGFIAVKKLLNWINNFRYTSLLGVAPRFHGMNTATANAILYSTIGKMIGPKDAMIGINAAFRGNSPSAKMFDVIALTTPSGKQFTYGELYEAVRVSGVRSEFNFVTSSINNAKILKFLKKNTGKKSGLGKKTIDFIGEAPRVLQDLTIQEDIVFRIGAMSDALRNGASIEAATAIARRSMFDYNDMFPAEKAFSTYAFIFYAFKRQNFVTFLKSLDKAENLKRYLNILKFDRGVEALSAELNDGKKFPHQAFYPKYTLSRQVLSVQDGQDKDWYLMGPQLPPMDSMLLLANVLDGDYLKEISTLSNPNIKSILQLEKTYNKKRISSEYINILSNTYSSDPREIANVIQMLVGGTVNPVQASEQNGAIDGWIYPLIDKKQQGRWNKFMFGMNYSGLSRPANDWSRVFWTEGTTSQNLDTIGRITTSIGLTTPAQVISPTQQDIYTVKAKLKEVQDQINEIEKNKKRSKDKLIIDSMKP